MNSDNTNKSHKNWSEWNTKIIEEKIRVGNRPPQPMLIPVNNNNVMYSFIDYSKPNDIYMFGINTKREPYAQVELITKYGNLNTRVGTNMGM